MRLATQLLALNEHHVHMKGEQSLLRDKTIKITNDLLVNSKIVKLLGTIFLKDSQSLLIYMLWMQRPTIFQAIFFPSILAHQIASTNLFELE